MKFDELKSLLCSLVTRMLISDSWLVVTAVASLVVASCCEMLCCQVEGWGA